MPNKTGTIRRAFSLAAVTLRRAAAVAALTVAAAWPGRLAAQRGDASAVEDSQRKALTERPTLRKAAIS